MTVPNYSINYFAPLAPGGSCNVGDVMIPDSTGSYYIVATSANRGTRGSEGIALTSWSGAPGAVGAVRLQQDGILPNEVSSLGAGAKAFVRTSTTGRPERVAGTPAASDDVIGIAEADGRVHLFFGLPSSTLTGLSLPFNIDSTTGQYISYGASGDTLPDVLNTLEGPIRLGQSTSVDGSRRGLIQWYSQAGQNINLLSVVGTGAFSTMALGWDGIASMQFYGGEFSFVTNGVGSAASFYLNTDGSNWGGFIFNVLGGAPGRLSIGSDSTSNNASFGGGDAGPMIKLHKLLTAPSGNPTHATNPAVWVYYDDAVPSLKVHFKGGQIFSIPASTGTASTSSFTAPTGTGFVTVTSGALDAAALAFPLAANKGGTGLSALGAGIATFLGTPSSANFIAALTDENGTGRVVCDTSPSITTPALTTPTISDPTISGTVTLSGATQVTSNDAKGIATDTNPVHVQTTDATVTTLDSFTLTTSDSAVVCSWMVIGIKSDGSQLGAYQVSASFKNDSGTCTQVGTTTVTVIGESDSVWDCTIDNSTTTIRLRVTGKAATTIQWTAICTRLQVIP